MLPTIQNPDNFFIFQMVYDKMAAIFPDFKWLGSQISDPIQNHFQINLFLINWIAISDPIHNPDHLQSNLFLII